MSEINMRQPVFTNSAFRPFTKKKKKKKTIKRIQRSRRFEIYLS